MLPTSPSSFFWDSELTIEEKNKIIELLNNLNKEEKALMEKWARDIRQESQFDSINDF